MSNLFWGVLEFTAAPLESATLGSKPARGQGLLFLGHGLTFSLAAPLATLTTGSRRGMGSGLASVGLATHIVHASGVISDSLAMMLFTVVAMAAQRAHTTGALMIC